MLDTPDFLQKYKEQLIELAKKGMLPQLDLKLEYKVYTIRGSEFGAHKSIVLTTDDEHFVTVELGFRKVNDKKHIYPATRPLEYELAAISRSGCGLKQKTTALAIGRHPCKIESSFLSNTGRISQWWAGGEA